MLIFTKTKLSKFHKTPPIMIQVAQNYKDIMIQSSHTKPLTILTYSCIKADAKEQFI